MGKRNRADHHSWRVERLFLFFRLRAEQQTALDFGDMGSDRQSYMERKTVLSLLNRAVEMMQAPDANANANATQANHSVATGGLQVRGRSTSHGQLPIGHTLVSFVHLHVDAPP